MEINTATLGPIDIDEKRVIRFVEPMPGMNLAGGRFALLDLNPDSPVKLLQDVDTPSLCFLVGDPKALFPDYVVSVSPEDLAALDLVSPERAAVLVTLSLMAGSAGMTANLKGPIVVNRDNFLAKQLVLQGSAYSLKTPVPVQPK